MGHPARRLHQSVLAVRLALQHVAMDHALLSDMLIPKQHKWLKMLLSFWLDAQVYTCEMYKAPFCFCSDDVGEHKAYVQ